VKAWCQTAYHFEILDCDDGSRFKLQPYLNEILGDKSHFRNYLANIELAIDHIGRYLSDYPDYYRTGKALDSLYEAALSKAVSETTKNMHLVFSYMIFPKNEALRGKLTQGCRCLEVGCGQGNLLVQLAQAFPNSTFVGVDPDPHGIGAARGKISHSGLEQRISVENIGGEALQYTDEFDIVYSVASVHEVLPGVRLHMLESAYQALKKDGQLIILDLPYPAKLEDFRDPMYNMGVMEQFVEICFGYVHLSTHERNEMLEKAGFRHIEQRPIGKGMFELVTASK